MLQTEWSEPAIQDLERIEEHIVPHDPVAAARVVLHVIDRVETYLSTNPAVGAAGSVFNTRELIVSKYPYRVVYQVRNTSIYILRVLHTAQKWP